MKERLSCGIAALFLCGFLSGCEVLCQGGSMTCGMSREQAEKVLHPKAYGEFWTKPGMSKEEWRADWMACGGRTNGQYSANVPLGSSDAVSAMLWEQTRKKLDACMQSKGYQFSRTH
jgi:hypothetical protein